MNLSLAGLRSEAAAKRAEHAKEREIALRARAAELEDALLVLKTKMLQSYRLPANELAAMRSESEAIEGSLLQVTEQLLEDEVERELEQTDETVQCQLTLAFMQGLPYTVTTNRLHHTRSVSVCIRARTRLRLPALSNIVLSACCIIVTVFYQSNNTCPSIWPSTHLSRVRGLTPGEHSYFQTRSSPRTVSHMTGRPSQIGSSASASTGVEAQGKRARLSPMLSCRT